MVLHTVNKSPTTASCLNNCLRALGERDALLLIEDGVYGADEHLSESFANLPDTVSLYALKADLEARGMMKRLSTKFRVIDDGEFVDLVSSFDKMQAWY